MAIGVEPERPPQPPAAEPAGPLGAFPAATATGQWRVVVRRFRRRRLAMAGLAVLAVLALSAVFASRLTPHDVTPTLSSDVLSQSRQSPSLRHPFGTDELGRDQLTRVLHGGRISLLVGLCVALASSIIGTTVGAVAGYFGGWVDQVLMRLVDLLLVLPGTALLMIAQKGLGSSLPVIILVLAFLFWRSIARIVRGLFLSLKGQEFVEAARASGASSARIIVSEMRTRSSTKEAATMSQGRTTLVSPARSALKKSCPIPGQAKIDSVMMTPPKRWPIPTADTVVNGMSAFRSAWRTSTLLLGTPLARAVRI